MMISPADKSIISEMLHILSCNPNIGKAKAEIAVAAIQTKVIRLICSSVKSCVSEGRLALSYCLPNFNNNSQKCGICPIKKKNPIAKAPGSVRLPPPATQPANGGKAPTIDPGTAAKAVTFLKVYKSGCTTQMLKYLPIVLVIRDQNIKQGNRK